jgi:sugar phosphate permease
MLTSSIVPLLIAALIWMIVRDDPGERGYASYSADVTAAGPQAGVFAGLRQVFSYRNTWLLTLAPGALAGSVLAFAGLWGVPFLTSHYGMSAPKAAATCSAMLLAWAVGGPVCGNLSDRSGRRKSVYMACCALIAAAWALVIFNPGQPLVVLMGLLMLIGFAAGGVIIGFAYLKETVPSQLGGTAAGVCNMGVMLGPMLLQPAVGWVLDSRWQGTTRAGARIYDMGAYRAGFSLMLAWAVLALICLALTREAGERPLS